MTFCTNTGTPYHRLQHRRATFDEVAALSFEGLNKSAIARVKQIAWNTVDRWLERAADNPTCGEARIADELLLKLGLSVSPRTIGKYLRDRSAGRTPDPAQRWLTFVHNHAQAVVACDFFVVVMARFRVLYVFVVLEVGRRRILHPRRGLLEGLG